MEGRPIVEGYSNYEMIMITGGEPLLFPEKLKELINCIRRDTHRPIYVYTAKMDDIQLFKNILYLTDGMTLTLHDAKDVKDFLALCEELYYLDIGGKSMRLNVFNETEMRESLIPYYWDYKYIDWIKDCPLPDGEDFRRCLTLL